MNLPNKLTIFRIILIPIMILVWLFPFAQFNIDLGALTFGFVTLPVKNIIILIIFAVASFTDFLDGYIARKNSLITTFGKFMDPIADKLLVNTTLLLLLSSGAIPFVPVFIMIARDTIVDGMRMVASSNGVVVAAGFLGKMKTVCQMIAIILLLLNNLPFELYNIPLSNIMLWFASFISAVSGISYYLKLKDYILESI